MMNYRSGMDLLWERDDCDALLRGRIGLVCHPASVTEHGRHAADLLHEHLGDRLCCLMGPEHGVSGSAGPGEPVAHARHSEWDIPVYSLYGDIRAAMDSLAREVDVIVFDLQDLGVRCYTYVHTLKLILEYASTHHLRVIVTDRAIPLSYSVDGPLLESRFASVVAPLNVPFVYGMTPGETARWIVSAQCLDLELTVIAAQYDRLQDAVSCWPAWIPPSPALRSLDCAACFPITVFTEAFPQLSCARDSQLAFQVLRADWLQPELLVERISAYELPGVQIEKELAVSASRGGGIRIRVTEPGRVQPALTSVSLIHALSQVHGVEWMWGHAETRADWFDKLMGTDEVRQNLVANMSPADIAMSWKSDVEQFRAQRQRVLMY